MRKKPRQPRQNTESRKERKPMEGTQFLYCETRKGSPRVNIEVCQAKCKKATKCKPLKEYQATANPTEGIPMLDDSLPLRKTDLIINYFRKKGIKVEILKAKKPIDGDYKGFPTLTEPAEEKEATNHPQFTADKTPYRDKGSDFSNIIDTATDRNKLDQRREPAEEEVLLDSDKATPIKQLDLFDFIDDPERKE